MGSQAEAVLDCVEDEEDSGRAKPIDIEYLLSNVVPSVLSLSGMFSLVFMALADLITVMSTFLRVSRFSFPAGQRFRIRQSIRQTASNSVGWSVPRCGNTSD
jgi:hypothetical protein